MVITEPSENIDYLNLDDVGLVLTIGIILDKLYNLTGNFRMQVFRKSVTCPVFIDQIMGRWNDSLKSQGSWFEPWFLLTLQEERPWYHHLIHTSSFHKITSWESTEFLYRFYSYWKLCFLMCICGDGVITLYKKRKRQHQKS